MVYALFAVILVLGLLLFVQDNKNRDHLWKISNKMIVLSDSLNVVTSTNHIGAMPVLLKALVRSIEHNRAAVAAYLQLNIPNSPEAYVSACEFRYAQASAKQSLGRVIMLLVELERKGQKVRQLVDVLKMAHLDADDVYAQLEDRYPSDGQHRPLLLLNDMIPGHWQIGDKK